MAFKIKCADLQLKLGWDEHTTIAEVMRLVEHEDFSTYRLVIVSPVIKSSKAADVSGDEYIEAGDFKIIYLYYDAVAGHFAAVRSPQELVRAVKKSQNYDWCTKCSESFARDQASCGCERETDDRPVQKRANKSCEGCGQLYWNRQAHQCGYTKCQTCAKFKKSGPELWTHRCPVTINPESLPAPFEWSEEETPDGARQLWVYDLESCRVVVEKRPNEHVFEFVADDENRFLVDEDEMPVVMETDKTKQVVTFVAYRNVFDPRASTKTATLAQFCYEMLNSNGGKNTCLAHNGSGYDTRLVFDEIIRTVGSADQLHTIMRGTKFMRMSVGKTVFQDSMLHLIGSLKNLAKDALGGADGGLRKGFFPHLFHTEDNFGYEGPLPAKKYFDLTFMAKNQRDVDEFNQWHDSFVGPWNFQTELKAYCINDVEVLTAIVRKHHYACVDRLRVFNDKLSFSPWHQPTSAGYVHKLFLANNATTTTPDPETGWAVLEPEEYYFARAALRGGRTEIRQFHYEGEVKDLDVQSMYPFIQMGKKIEVHGEEIPLLFPVGLPVIHIFDLAMFPCRRHWADPFSDCGCVRGLPDLNSKLIVQIEDPGQDLHSFLDGFFGILCVDVTPPTNLYHPVLPTFDSDKQLSLIHI